MRRGLTVADGSPIAPREGSVFGGTAPCSDNSSTPVRRPGGRAMAEDEGPKVVLRGPGEGDTIILPMGEHQAHITRKAARTETGGHWAIGEAWQDPDSTIPRTRTTRQRPSTSSKVRTPSTPTPLRQKASDRAPSCSFLRGRPRVPHRSRRRATARLLAIDRRSRVLQRPDPARRPSRCAATARRARLER